MLGSIAVLPAIKIAVAAAIPIFPNAVRMGLLLRTGFVDKLQKRANEIRSIARRIDVGQSARTPEERRDGHGR
jgi:hypothetical protein